MQHFSLDVILFDRISRLCTYLNTHSYQYVDFYSLQILLAYQLLNRNRTFSNLTFRATKFMIQYEEKKISQPKGGIHLKNRTIRHLILTLHGTGCSSHDRQTSSSKLHTFELENQKKVGLLVKQIQSNGSSSELSSEKKKKKRKTRWGTLTKIFSVTTVRKF